MSGLEVVALIVFAVVVFGVFLLKEKRLADPTNTQMIYVDQMVSNHQLPSGPVVAALIGQSGNIYRELGAFSDAAAAFAEINKAFRRAGITSVGVVRNTALRYEVVRLHHSHGGKAEGKKLGGALLIPA